MNTGGEGTMSGRVASGDVQIYYEVRGAGTPLVFLHGNSEDGRYFDRQAAFFAEHYRVVVIDSRGHGRSTCGRRGALPFAAMAGDVLAVLDALAIDRAAIVGFSDGGNVALHLALATPERLRAMVLVGANLSPAGMKRSARALITAGYVGYALRAPFSAKARAAKARWALMVFHPRLTAGDIAVIGVPTLVMAGERDVVRERHTRLIADTIRDAALQVVPGAGHFIATEQPERFQAAVFDFLKNHGL
jgi:pimeloyl-ACP methyl ester carboxylesterase